MKNDPTTSSEVAVGTLKQFSYKDLEPNPQNPRRLFDAKPLNILAGSIRKNGILVPLTVYKEERSGKYFIIDGERRWRCAEIIETDKKNPQKVIVPANIVNPPDKLANILQMFNIHNLREQWDLMPTALSLKIVMDKLGEVKDEKLAELTHLSLRRVQACKILLSFDEKYQKMMLHPDPEKRMNPNFFLEMHPVLEIYRKMPPPAELPKTREALIEHFLDLYKNGKIKSVVHFRKILEARDFIGSNKQKEENFREAARELIASREHSIPEVFDPLIKDDKSVENAQELCKDFLKKIQKFKIAHTSDPKQRKELKSALQSIEKYVKEILQQLYDDKHSAE